MLSTLFAHHVELVLMGREFAPEGMVQHTLLIGGLIVLFGLAGVGFMTVLRRFSARPEKGQPAKI